MIKIIDAIDIVNDLLLIDDVNVGLNDVKYVNSVNDVNIVTNANNNYFYWVNDIKNVKNIKDVNDMLDLLTIDINDLHASDDVKNDNDFDHCCQTRLLTELINGSYDRGRFQEQYLLWLLVTKMASGSLITIFVDESSICATLATPGDKTEQLRKLVNGPGGRY